MRADVHDIRALLGSTVIVKLQLMQDALHDGRLSTVDQMLAGTLTIAKSINDSILHVMDDLQDATLSEEGLQAAIENYVQRYWPDCDVTITSNLKERLAPHIEGQLYRIAQEAIANACEHGIAKRQDGCVQVVLMYDRNEHTVVLRVADNGCGFDVGAERLPTIGLLMMKERAKRLRTELILHSTSAGTIVTVIVSTIIDLEDEGV